jgi:GTPase
VRGVDTPSVLVVNKTDVASPADIAAHLADAVAELGEFDAFVPLSARTGVGVDSLVGELEARLPEGPHYYPEGMVTDQPESFLAAELVREQLLKVARDELPHSITVVAEIDDPDADRGARGREADRDDDPVLHVHARILVERESQKGMVIGKGGLVLKEAGTRAREELERLLGTRVHLETRVAVERDWQRRAHALDRLGY